MSFHHYYQQDYQRLLQLTNGDHVIKDFEATLDGASNLLELADTLQDENHRSIETVRINIHDSFAGTNLPSDMLVFFEALGSQPKKLNRVFLGTFRYISSQCTRLPVQPLSVSLIQATKLTYLEICGLEFTGTGSDFTTLGASIHNHPSLREVKLYNCRLPTTAATTSAGRETQRRHLQNQASSPTLFLLDPLVKSLGSIRSLRRVVLNASTKGSLGKVSPQALGILCGGGGSGDCSDDDGDDSTATHDVGSSNSSSNRIQAVGLLGYDFQDDHLEYLAKALTDNNSIKEVCLGQVRLTQKGDKALAQLLRSNSSALEYLDLQLSSSVQQQHQSDHDHHDHDGGSSLSPPAGPATTTTLQSEPIQIAKALPHNTRLKHFFVHGKLTTKCQQAFCNAVIDAASKGGTSPLESMELMDGSPYMSSIRFHLRMNAMLARARLTTTTTTTTTTAAARNGQGQTTTTTFAVATAAANNNRSTNYHNRWLELLIGQRNDVSALFFLISHNPLLCCNNTQ